ncbi:hypothetical protein DW091_17170 [Eubacterium sp. AM05-23]|uniref:hypothetical protein n=1 Tax=Eubacterium TaxID=1730 RepID=UPI000E4FD5CB|nr:MULTISPECIES: hypothetical protein [Eubacterium]RHO54673.1 hypothetical protein DW091_17170 [Eubacterium sp. AM05-23]
MENNDFSYKDIIDQVRPISKRHSPMANADRAKQFSPFAALKGYEEALQLKQKRYTPRIELTEDAKSLLDRKLHILNQWLENGQKPIVTIRYFVPKPVRNPGKTVGESDIELGSYLEISGAAEKINSETQRIQISGESLGIDDVVDLQKGPLTGTSEKTVCIFEDDCV